MEISKKQAMHLEPGKSFGSAEANENERRWEEKKIDDKNRVPTNHYDKTRMHLNFEIGEDRKVHPLGFHRQNLDIRLEKRLLKLGWHPFKEGSKIQPNCCAKFIFGGDHDRTLQMAFGNQEVNIEKGADNSNLQRCKEIEDWAIDVYSWCAKRYGQENIIGFQVHLDETSPHIHALIVPVGERGKDKHPCVMWSAKFGKNVYEYGKILREMHTSLYEEVGCKYGLERGDSVHGRNVEHLNKTEYIRKLNKEIKEKEKAIKSLQTMISNLTDQQVNLQHESETIRWKLMKKEGDARQLEDRIAAIEDDLKEVNQKIDEKLEKLRNVGEELLQKQEELKSMSADVKQAYTIRKPFVSIGGSYTIPKITSRPPTFGADKWVDQQNDMIKRAFADAIHKMAETYQNEAKKQVEEAQKNVIFDISELHNLRAQNLNLSSENQELNNQLTTLLDQFSTPSLRSAVLKLAGTIMADESFAGGGETSDLRWDGRRPGEDEDSFARRCLLYASKSIKMQNAYKRRR